MIEAGGFQSCQDRVVRVPELLVRERKPSDIPRLGEILMDQQPSTRYPFRNPLPVPVEHFLHADDALGAWTAVADGQVAGHVCRTGHARGFALAESLNDACVAAYGCQTSDLTWVSSFFVAEAARGRGVGRLLMETVVGDAERDGLKPCLEVLPNHPGAISLYLSMGWKTVLTIRPDWLTSAVGNSGPDVCVMVLVRSHSP